MNAAPPTQSELRLARLRRWLALTVTWFAAHVLARVAPCAAARLLTHYARAARVLLVATALSQVECRSRGAVHRPADMRRLTIRRVIGGAMRRSFRKRSLRDRAAAIGEALASPSRWIAMIVRRLRRRFTRLARTPALRRTPVRVLMRAPLAAHAVNSS